MVLDKRLTRVHIQVYEPMGTLAGTNCLALSDRDVCPKSIMPSAINIPKKDTTPRSTTLATIYHNEDLSIGMSKISRNLS